MKLRHFIPANLRLQFRLLRRFCKDFFNKTIFYFAEKQDKNSDFLYKITLTQAILPTSFFENKVHNIQQGAAKIEKVIVKPNQILSFWHCIQKPSRQNGFRIGRNLINGKLSEDYGGGLCQLSSILYHLSLIAGLQIEERHHHSFDIYEDQQRFTPLGADATVVYAYKDFRVKNNFDFPIYFVFEIQENTLHCQVFSSQKINQKEVFFDKTTTSEGVLVETQLLEGNEKIIIATSFYHKNSY
jgi:vancomycin resistance protein VanW